MTDRYDDRYDGLWTAAEPDRAEALREALRARLLDPGGENLEPPASALPMGEELDHPSLPSYDQVGSAERPEHRGPSWPRVAAVAAALLLVLVAVVAAIHLSRGDDTVDVGPEDSRSTERPRDPTVVARITIPSGADEVSAAGDAVWVASTSHHLVSRIDATTNQIVASIATSQSPQHLAATDDAVWVVGTDMVGLDLNDATTVVSRIDPATNGVVATVGLPGRVTTQNDVTVTGDAVWVAAGFAVVRIDPATNQIAATIPVADPAGIDSTGDAVWVASSYDKLVRIEPATNQIVATITARDLPDGTTSDSSASGLVASDDAVWRTVSDGRTLLHVDPRTNGLDASLTVPAAVSDVAFDGSAVWLLLADDTLYRLDPATSQTTRIMGLDFGLQGFITVTPDAVWVTSVDGGSVTRIDPGAG